jgi:ZIP family zinc transporter
MALAATSFSLLVPGLDHGTVGEVLAGFALGSGFIALLDAGIPHAHARFRERGRVAAEDRVTRRAALLLAALTIHNIPEGLAVGLAFAAGGADLGVPLALAIGIQNVPEGFAAAAPLVGAGVSRRSAALVAALPARSSRRRRSPRSSPSSSPTRCLRRAWGSRPGRCSTWSSTS